MTMNIELMDSKSASTQGHTAVTKLPISLIVITFNEEKNIERCIRSAPFVSDILVVDSGSQDRTIDIARRLGARIQQEPWRGFAKQKIRATALARCDWVLSLDADEALSSTAQASILKLFQTAQFETNADAYSFARMAYYLGQWMRHGGMYPDRQTRLYHKARAKWTETQVHEHIEAAKVEALDGDILHWSFADIAHHIETVNRYSTLRSQDFKAKGYRFSSRKMLVKTIGKFFEAYVLKKGFRDGRAGLIAAMVTSFATFLRWGKLCEIELSQIGSKESRADRR